jgi:hypothetical protein
MVKKRCSQCRYWFAVPVTEAEATALSGTVPQRPVVRQLLNRKFSGKMP